MVRGELRRSRIFALLKRMWAKREALILKPNMAPPGSASPERPAGGAVAEFTRSVLRRVVPGVAFLSDRQSVELATARPSGDERLARPEHTHSRPEDGLKRGARAAPAISWSGSRDSRRRESRSARRTRRRCAPVPGRRRVRPPVRSTWLRSRHPGDARDRRARPRP